MALEFTPLDLLVSGEKKGYGMRTRDGQTCPGCLLSWTRTFQFCISSEIYLCTNCFDLKVQPAGYQGYHYSRDNRCQRGPIKIVDEAGIVTGSKFGCLIHDL